MLRILIALLFLSFAASGSASYVQSKLAERIENGEYIKSKTFYWLDSNNKIYYTTQGYSRVPRAYRNYVYLTNEEAIDGYYRKVNFSYFESKKNKAWINSENNWLYHWGEKTEELAVLGAFYNCEFMGLKINECKLLYINDQRITNYDDMYWTRFYLDNKDNYIFKAGPSKRLVIEEKGKSSINESKEGQLISSGTGFFISKRGDILTNFHVIENCEENMKGRVENDIYPLKFIARDKTLDLALLQAGVNNKSYIPLESSAPRKLQRVIVAGYPLGKVVSDDLKFNSGVISSLKGPNDDSSLIQIDAAVNMGNSGGPIVNEKNGHLIGVVVSGFDKSITEGFNFGIKSSSVKSFLNSNAFEIPSSSSRYLKLQSEELAERLEETTLYIFCSK
tara:strand:- start:118 stop:1293 length:1176 start_codon:yes stop_codon:yes gene_type:complete